jgi:hypothetical protein
MQRSALNQEEEKKPKKRTIKQIYEIFHFQNNQDSDTLFLFSKSMFKINWEKMAESKVEQQMEVFYLLRLPNADSVVMRLLQ